ncbi:MAG: helix-turn-helix domain-containing protein [Devosia sp.]
MEFALHFPRGRLAATVESLVFSSDYAPLHQREKLIPEGVVQIIVDLTERPKRLYAGETTPVGVDFTKSWISGIQQRWIVIEAQRGASMMVIQFRPGGAQALTGHDASTLANSVHPLADVMNGTASSLRDRVLEAEGIAAKFAATESWLLERLSDARPLHPAIQRLAGELGRPGRRVRDLAAAAGLSDRQLRSIFAETVGVSPKSFARIARFQALLRALARTGRDDPMLEGEALPPPDWAVLAAETGYFDQSHMNHEFMAFAGMTPGAYAAAYRGQSNYLPITLPR